MDWLVICFKPFMLNVIIFNDILYIELVFMNMVLATCTLSVITTILAAYQYGISTAPNVLEMLPNNNLLYAAILLVTLQLCLSHAIGSSAMFQNIEEYLKIPKCMYLFHTDKNVLLLYHVGFLNY